MVTALETSCLKLLSKPYKYRAGLMPMAIALAVGFIFSCLWLGISIWMMFQSGTEFLVWGLLIGASTILYLIYLGLAAHKLVGDGKRQYCLELTDTEAVLSVSDHMTKKRSTQMVLLNDIVYGEYYPYPDSCLIILRAPYADMEVPLWPFGPQAQDAVDFLEGRGVKVINVQSDDRIPE